MATLAACATAEPPPQIEGVWHAVGEAGALASVKLPNPRGSHGIGSWEQCQR